MPDPITDPPSPEHQAETERLAGELLKGPDPEVASPAVMKAMFRFYRALSDRYRRELDESRAEAERLRDAILKHRHQRGDDRCWLDDDELYAVLGDSYVCYRELPAECEFLESCRRYWRQRQTPDERDTPRPECEMTIGQMQEEIPALRSRVADLSRAFDREATLRSKAERERDALVGGSLGAAGRTNGSCFREWAFAGKRGAGWGPTPAEADARARAGVRKAAGLDAGPEGGA